MLNQDVILYQRNVHFSILDLFCDKGLTECFCVFCVTCQKHHVPSYAVEQDCQRPVEESPWKFLPLCLHIQLLHEHKRRKAWRCSSVRFQCVTESVFHCIEIITRTLENTALWEEVIPILGCFNCEFITIACAAIPATDETRQTNWFVHVFAFQYLLYRLLEVL